MFVEELVFGWGEGGFGRGGEKEEEEFFQIQERVQSNLIPETRDHDGRKNLQVLPRGTG